MSSIWLVTFEQFVLDNDLELISKPAAYSYRKKYNTVENI